MNLLLDTKLADAYKISQSQKSKALTEPWVLNNFNCPFCNSKLYQHHANNKCADFYCKKCNEDFELKSCCGKFSRNKITGSAYEATVEKISSNKSSNWILLERNDEKVTGLIFIPKYFFYSDMIEKRNPLSDSAQRKGWIGCLIHLNMIPSFGKIQYVKNGKEVNKKLIKYKLDRAIKFKNIDPKHKDWKLEILSIIDSIPETTFSLDDLYEHIEALKPNHQKNSNIDANIRGTMQCLRDEGYIKFLDSEGYRGLYQKLF